MSLSEMVMTLLRIIVSTIITSALAVAVNMIWRHGNRWFRGARKFVRTGRWKSGPRARWQRREPVQVAQGMKEPRMTLTRALTLLAQLAGRQAPPPAGTRYPPQTSTFGEGDDLNLKF